MAYLKRFCGARSGCQDSVSEEHTGVIHFLHVICRGKVKAPAEVVVNIITRHRSPQRERDKVHCANDSRDTDCAAVTVVAENTDNMVSYWVTPAAFSLLNLVYQYTYAMVSNVPGEYLSRTPMGVPRGLGVGPILTAMLGLRGHGDSHVFMYQPNMCDTAIHAVLWHYYNKQDYC